MVNLSGTITALITPFNEDGSVDYEGYVKNIQFQLKNGINGLLPLGTTGETPTLRLEEQEKIMRLVVQEAKGKVPILIGTGKNNTASSVKISKLAEKIGADAVLVVTPYYNKPTDEGIYQHFKAINDAISIPIIVYNIGGRTGKNISTDLMQRLETLEHVEYVKEASGNMLQMADVLEKTNLTVLSGDDGVAVPLMSLGGRGVISVLSNLFPGRMVQMCEAALSGDFKKARKIHFELQPFMRAEFIETNPIPIKYMMNQFGLHAGGYRLPMCELTQASKEKIDILLRENKLTPLKIIR